MVITVDLHLLNILDVSLGQFTVSPSTEIVPEGGTSRFECQHINADNIGWRINGSSISHYSTPDIVSSTNDVGKTLSIIARSQYNESRIECIAFFFDGRLPQTSIAVKLIVQG